MILAALVFVGPTEVAATEALGSVKLTDGRTLEYAEYGDPRGPLVVFLHGTPGSRFDLATVADALRATGVRVIAPNRPGIGGSTPAPGRRILDWPSDVVELVDAVAGRGKKFGVVGMSGGACYTLACARQLPRRVTRAAIVSGYAPPEANVPGGSVERTLGLIERRPNLAAVGANVLGRRLDRRPDSVVERVAQSWSEEDRRTVLGSAELRKAVAKTLSEATRTGSTGVVLDAQLLGAPWGFDVSEASGVPIAVHHGGADDVAPAAMGQWFHEHLRGSTLSFDPTAGHITYTLKHVAEIFKPFAGNAKGASPIPDVAEPLVR